MAPKRIRLSGKYRLITRSDFDGLACGMLLQEAGLVDVILFAHPKDVQDGTIDVDSRDIIAGLPFVPGCEICFDVRNNENINSDLIESGHFVCDTRQGSVARLLYTWLGGRLAFPRLEAAMLTAVDKFHAAQYTIPEILEPTSWVLLGFLMDARTGLGRFKEFRLSNYQLMMELIPYCRHHRIAEILQHPDVAERIQVYQDHAHRCREQILRCTRVEGCVGILDLRHEDTIWAGNRFLIYALFPQITVSIHAIWGLRRQNTVFAVGRSIVNNKSQQDIGEILSKYNGGGQPAAGSCQVPHPDSDRVLSEIVAALNR